MEVNNSIGMPPLFFKFKNALYLIIYIIRLFKPLKIRILDVSSRDGAALPHGGGRTSLQFEGSRRHYRRDSKASITFCGGSVFCKSRLAQNRLKKCISLWKCLPLKEIGKCRWGAHWSNHFGRDSGCSDRRFPGLIPPTRTVDDMAFSVYANLFRFRGLKGESSCFVR
jgi:hypothetical protein